MQALRIFAHASIGSTLSRPRRGVLVTPLHLVDEEPDDVLDADEAHLLDILASAPDVGETIDAAYRRKERELADAFARLTRAEASALQRRLSDPQAADTLAQRFARLVVDRRTRLLAILASTRRLRARSVR